MLFAAAVGPPVLGMIAGQVAPALARRMPPRLAAVTLTLTALTVSLTVGMLLCLVGVIALAEGLPGSVQADWAPSTLRRAVPVPLVPGLVIGVVAGALLACATAFVVRFAGGLRRSSKAAARLSEVDGLAVVDDPDVHAFAVPGRHARIVVSTGMLRLLNGSERRALLAHERAHLSHHHYVYAQLSHLAAAANPLMRPVARAVDVALERWADAAAVGAVGDPATVAHAVGTAALARSRAALPTAALGAVHAVVERVRYLLEPPPTRRRNGWFLAGVMLACWVCAVAVTVEVHTAVEIAEAAARR